ncbi:hypothetical protein PoB_005951800 [Plakobranchus ocellatus]|uniref:Uncharacterized protein n=1 Tax=Plakobranchus ocellatus TaxID=259542 RepID=A0AAV4CN71_9GAST|nr:hypothetical protein PoB_005951800 [Plakobranchus ocellatus]
MIRNTILNIEAWSWYLEVKDLRRRHSMISNGILIIGGRCLRSQACDLEIRYDFKANRTVFFGHYLQANCSVFADLSYTVAWELPSGARNYSIPPNDSRIQTTVDPVATQAEWTAERMILAAREHSIFSTRAVQPRTVLACTVRICRLETTFLTFCHLREPTTISIPEAVCLARLIV